MKKTYSILSLIIILLLVCLVIYNSAKNEQKLHTTNSNFGNTNGNISENGTIISNGEWIYYTNSYDKDYIYRMKKDGSNKECLLKRRAYNLNLMNNKIYFIGGAPGKVYSFDLETYKCRKLVSDEVENLIVTDSYMFFRESSYYEKYNRLYKTDLNGNGKKMLVDGAVEFAVDFNRIYYTEDENAQIYSIDLEGNNNIKLSDAHALKIALYDKYIYYCDSKNNYKLYRIEKTGGSPELISSDACWNINIYKDKIYYRKQNKKANLYVMDLDGSNDRIIAKGNITEINVIDEYIMFRRVSENSGYYLINSDGKEVLMN